MLFHSHSACLFIDASHLFHGQSDSHASAPSVSSVSKLPHCHQVHLRARSSTTKQQRNLYFFFPRKEVIQPHLPIRLPCYDFTPVTVPAFGSSLPLLSTTHLSFDSRRILLSNIAELRSAITTYVMLTRGWVTDFGH